MLTGNSFLSEPCKGKSTESIFIYKWRETFKLVHKEKVIVKPDAHIRSLQMFEGYRYYLQANDSKIQQFQSYSLVREGCLQASSSPNYRDSLGKHTLQLQERRKFKCGKKEHNVQKTHSLGSAAVICVATCLLLYNPSAYQIPLFRYMCGLGRLKLTGYLLGQWANAPCVHPYILLSTAMRERKKNKRTGRETLEMMDEKQREKQKEEVCVRQVLKHSRQTMVSNREFTQDKGSVCTLDWSSVQTCVRLHQKQRTQFLRKTSKVSCWVYYQELDLEKDQLSQCLDNSLKAVMQFLFACTHKVTHAAP